MTTAFRSLALLTLVGMCSGISLHAQPTVLAEFSVATGAVARMDSPVSASLEGVPLGLALGPLGLFEITAGADRPVPFQHLPGNPGQLVWTLDGATAPGVVRSFQLRRLNGSEPGAPNRSAVAVENDGESLTVSVGGRRVLAYRHAIQPVPEGVDQIFQRSGFIHPLWSPGGEVLSRMQPPDHHHHYGLWNPWTSTEFEGRHIDFWNLGEGQGTVRHEQIVERIAGEVVGGFKALLSHIDLSGPEGEKVALKEQWDVRVWHADEERKVWLVDFMSTLSPATDSALTIKAYRYQGFSLRATEKWNDQTATLRTSAGFDKSNGNGTRARWLDVNGVSDTPEGRSGVLFMSHPGNYNHPEQLRVWPIGENRGIENVFINFNPAQEQDFVLEPGHTYVLKYRMLVYDGQIDTDTAERAWRDFADPPHVKVYPVGRLAGARLLVYTRNEREEGMYVHENIPYSVAALQRLAVENGFEVEVSDDPSLFTEENLRRYDALIFSNSNNDAFETDDQRAALQAYIRQGGGFVGIHSASGSERGWPWFSSLLGGNFVRHPPSQDFTVEVVDSAHPSTGFLPGRWVIPNDECYYLDELSPRIRVLLAADLTTVEDADRATYPGEVFGDRFPVAWYQEFDGGRQWYTALGHRPQEYEDPMLMRHILGGIQWAVGGSRP